MASNNDEVNERIFCTLMFYYVALYNDNVAHLNELLDKGYNFGNREMYFYLFTKQNKLFRKFYVSLKYSRLSTSLSDDEIIDTFCRI